MPCWQAYLDPMFLVDRTSVDSSMRVWVKLLSHICGVHPKSPTDFLPDLFCVELFSAGGVQFQCNGSQLEPLRETTHAKAPFGYCSVDCSRDAGVCSNDGQGNG